MAGDLHVLAAVFLAFLALPAKLASAENPQLLPGDETWLTLETPHFRLFTSTGKQTLNEQALGLEELQRAVAREAGQLELKSPLPSYVYIFKTRARFQIFLDASSRRGSTRVVGLFLPHVDGNYILVDGSAGARPMRIVYHEYVHYLVNNNFDDVPVWFNEGLAEFFSTFLCGSKGIEIGRPIVSHMEVMGEAPLLPLSELLRIDQSSPHYNEDSRAGILYAQSWALVHYVLVGRTGHEVDWTRYPTLLSRGVTPEEAFEQAFELDERGLDEELSQYAAQEKWPSRKISRQENELYSPGEPVALAPADALCRLGDLMSHVDHDGNPAEARPWYEEALRRSPGHAEAQAGLERLKRFSALNTGEEPLPSIDDEIARVNSLIEEDRLEEAVDVIKALIARTTDPRLHSDLRGKMAELELVIQNNRQVDRYNEAVERANEGRYDEALKILDDLLKELPEGELRTNAVSLRDEIKMRMPKRKG